MGRTAIRVCVAAVLATAGAAAAAEPWGEPAIAEVTGRVAFEGRGFLAPPRFPGQRRHGVSVAVEPELYLEWDDYTSLTVAPFLRLDSADPERSHGDVRELYLRIVRDDWELGLGIGKLFWGVVESFHLVDVVNQTDLIENIDLEDKLGQPMVNLTLVRDWGYVDMVYMPRFRDRTFQGRRGRLRNALVAAGSLADHEPGAGRWYPGLAVRYSNSFGAWDAGVYQFHGLAREPSFGLALDAAGAPVLAPFYEIINQTGADVQYTAGAWLWKLEALFRQGQRNRRGGVKMVAMESRRRTTPPRSAASSIRSGPCSRPTPTSACSSSTCTTAAATPRPARSRTTSSPAPGWPSTTRRTRACSPARSATCPTARACSRWKRAAASATATS